MNSSSRLSHYILSLRFAIFCISQEKAVCVRGALGMNAWKSSELGGCAPNHNRRITGATMHQQRTNSSGTCRVSLMIGWPERPSAKMAWVSEREQHNGVGDVMGHSPQKCATHREVQ